jgi:hypothetical protein
VSITACCGILDVVQNEVSCHANESRLGVVSVESKSNVTSMAVLANDFDDLSCYFFPCSLTLQIGIGMAL